MAQKSEPEDKPKYMTQAEVAHHLRCSVPTVRNLIDDGELLGVKLTDRPNSGVRVNRASFEAYCGRIEAEYAKRIGRSA